MRIRFPAFCVVALGVLTLTVPSAIAPPQEKPEDRQANHGSEPKLGDYLFGFPNLVAGLKATPGCLGVEVARTLSGKNVIFAWFENKEAVLKWYHSDMHQQLMKKFFPDQKFGEPLGDVPDYSGPILAIASATLSTKSAFKETALPISQIAIELYQPLGDGKFLGGHFAPEGLKVPKQKGYTRKDK